MNSRKNGIRSPRPIDMAAQVIDVMAEHAHESIVARRWWQNVILAVIAGSFITAGALFSLLLSAGVETPGPSAVLLGLGFSTGFFFVIVTRSVLFTEVNVLVPARLLNMSTPGFCANLGRFWMIAAVGNVLGALLIGSMVHFAHPLHDETLTALSGLIEKKMSFESAGGTVDWLRIVASGVLANWLVGIAAFLSILGRTIVDKVVPIVLAVTLFVAANFQHSPANAGYFALAIPSGVGPSWSTAIVWNLLPAAIGNVIGAGLLVALPFHLAFKGDEKP